MGSGALNSGCVIGGQTGLTNDDDLMMMKCVGGGWGFDGKAVASSPVVCINSIQQECPNFPVVFDSNPIFPFPVIISSPRNEQWWPGGNKLILKAP